MEPAQKLVSIEKDELGNMVKKISYLVRVLAADDSNGRRYLAKEVPVSSEMTLAGIKAAINLAHQELVDKIQNASQDWEGQLPQEVSVSPAEAPGLAAQESHRQ